MRIMHARELLRDTDKSVMEVALECGFNNTSNFYRLYKKYVENHPGKARVKKRGENSIKYGVDNS